MKFPIDICNAELNRDPSQAIQRVSNPWVLIGALLCAALTFSAGCGGDPVAAADTAQNDLWGGFDLGGGTDEPDTTAPVDVGPKTDATTVVPDVPVQDVDAATVTPDTADIAGPDDVVPDTTEPDDTGVIDPDVPDAVVVDATEDAGPDTFDGGVDIPKPPVDAGKPCENFTGTLDPNAAAGSLVITEMMINPSAADDEFGEWFEIYNPGNTCIGLGGMVVADPGGVDLHVVAGNTLVVPPKGYVVLGRSADKTKNGNVDVDYVLSNFGLDNLNDGIILKTNLGTVLDQVSYALGSWPMIDLSGVAASLSSDVYDAAKNDVWQTSNEIPVWCFAAAPWFTDPNTGQPAGDKGSPGAANPLCPKPLDTDSDGVPDKNDNCPNDPNGPDGGPNIQLDGDKDGVGDVCDNCPNVINKDQANKDDNLACFLPEFQGGKCDKAGDACDKQTCGDGEADLNEECDDGNTAKNDGCEECKVKPIVPAKVYITEIFTSTNQVPQGRWIEIHSTDPDKIDLSGWTIETGIGGSHTIVGPLEIATNQTLVIGDTKSQLFNGKVPVDYAWQTGGQIDIKLDPNGDTIKLVNNGKVIDSVDYGIKTPAPKTGVSLQLDNKFYGAALNDNINYWCYSDKPWLTLPGADLGSPGAVNVTCVPPDGDKDGDGKKNGEDNCVYVANPGQSDGDNDGFGDDCDNCKVLFNPDQEDTDADGVGNLCDNCPKAPNPLQEDQDKNGYGDKCDSTKCGDGQVDIYEECDDGNKNGGDGCSSVCHKESFTPGAVVISEVMIAPQKVQDSVGEWIELHNTTAGTIDVNGWTLHDKGFSKHVIMSIKPLPIAPGGYLVLASEGDDLKNGGVKPDYVYSGLMLPNQVGNVVLEWNGKPIDSFSYWVKGALCAGDNNPPGCADNGWDPCLGKAQSLDPLQLDATKNDKHENWCCSKAKFGMGDYGSPGKANPSCINPCIDPKTKEKKPDKTPCDPTGKLLWCINGECVDQPKCGDGTVNQDSEECDDGNNKGGDGCDAVCKKEPIPQKEGTVIITEIMPNSDADAGNDENEYIELFNPTSKPIDLLGWSLSDDPHECEFKSGQACNETADCVLCKTDAFGNCLMKDGKPVVEADYGNCIPNKKVKADMYVIQAKCGNGATEGKEECDDGNTQSGDGCSSSCLVEGSCASLQLNGQGAHVPLVKLQSSSTVKLPFGSSLAIQGWFMPQAESTSGKCADAQGTQKACSDLFSYGLGDEYHVAVRAMDNKLYLVVGASQPTYTELGPLELNKWTHIAFTAARTLNFKKIAPLNHEPFGGLIRGFVNGRKVCEYLQEDWPWDPVAATDGTKGASKATIGGQELKGQLIHPFKGRVTSFHVSNLPQFSLPFGPQVKWSNTWKGGTWQGNIVRLPLDEGQGTTVTDKAGNGIVAGNSGGVWTSPASGTPSGPYCVQGGKLLPETTALTPGYDRYILKPMSYALIMTTYNVKARNNLDPIATWSDDLSGGYFDFANNTDQIIVKNPQGEMVDKVGYDSKASWKWGVGYSAMLKPGGCTDTVANDKSDCWVTPSAGCFFGMLWGISNSGFGCNPAKSCLQGGVCNNLPHPVKCNWDQVADGSLKGYCCKVHDRGTPGAQNICPL